MCQRNPEICLETTTVTFTILQKEFDLMEIVLYLKKTSQKCLFEHIIVLH